MWSIQKILKKSLIYLSAEKAMYQVGLPVWSRKNSILFCNMSIISIVFPIPSLPMTILSVKNDNYFSHEFIICSTKTWINFLSVMIQSWILFTGVGQRLKPHCAYGSWHVLGSSTCSCWPLTKQTDQDTTPCTPTTGPIPAAEHPEQNYLNFDCSRSRALPQSTQAWSDKYRLGQTKNYSYHYSWLLL